MMDDVTRPSLILRVRDSGDKNAWQEFCTLYQPLIRRYIARFAVAAADADDLVQEMFLKLRDQMPGFELAPARGRFRAWLRRCTDNHVRDWLRAEGRRQAAVSEVDIDSISKSFDDNSTADETRQIEWRRAVLALVIERAQLEFKGNDTTWQCFRLSTLENRPAKEIAERLGIDKVNNVHVYAHRVLARVKALCGEYDEEADDSVA